MIYKREFNFIEVQVKWRGQLASTDIAKQFLISKGSSKRILQEYKKLHPSQLYYCKYKKTNLPQQSFSSIYSEGKLIELAQYHDKVFLAEQDQNQPYFATIKLPTHYISPSLVSNLLIAIEARKRLEVNYISLRSTDYDGRIIAPHHFVFDGHRWHVRAYDEKNQAFLDFNLSRFSGSGEFEEDLSNTPTVLDDIEWQTFVDVVIVPDPRLSNAQKQCIEREYQMENGQLIIPTRAALVKYLLLRLRLDIFKNIAEAQQIMLEPECQKTLRPFLPNNY